MLQFNSCRSLQRLLLTVFCFFSIACNHNKPDVTLLNKIFLSIQQNQWQNYLESTITIADLHPKITAELQKLKANQQKFQQQDFERAVKGGPGQIDFKNSQMVGLGSELATVEVLADYPLGKVYSIRLKIPNGKTTVEMDSREFYPQFLVVQKNNQPHLLALIFPGE
jgi:hypothetical protein